MKMDKSIIFLVVLGALIFLYFALFYTKIDFEISSEMVSVNIHDTINLKDYILKAKNENRKDLTNKVTISVVKGSSDTLKNGELFVGDFSTKTVTYTLKHKFKTVTRKLEILVITDPNDPDFKPNYDYTATDENTDDVPDSKINSNLTESQKKYLESLKQ